jgi:sulfate adenylyltransferase subunit 2
MAMTQLTHLQRLEAESIHIMREVVAEAENPVMLYSIGKDSTVMLHLAMAMGINPFDHGSEIHTDLWRTQGLNQALNVHGFDAAFGGGRERFGLPSNVNAFLIENDVWQFSP